MATIPSEITWVSGQVVTAAQLNSNLRDAVNFLINRPMVELRQTVAQSFATGNTTTAMTWDTEDFDNDNMHSTVTNPSRITATTAGRYHFGGGIAWSANATLRRGSWYRINGTSVTPSGETMLQSTSSGVAALPVRAITYFLNAGDYVEVIGYQESGGALSTNVATDVSEQPSFNARWIGTT